MKKRQKVRIYWNDAVLYKKPKEPLQMKPSPKVTEGFLVDKKMDEYKEYVSIEIGKNPKSGSLPEKGITFFVIPKGMIDKIENL